MRKLNFLLLLLLAWPIEMLADDQLATLIVKMKSGSETAFFLKDKPQVKFEGTNLKVTSSAGDATFALADVLRFTYAKKDPAGINETIDEKTGVALQDDVLVISQMKANSTVNVYSMDGKLVRQLTAQRAGTYRLSLSSLPAGVYIVKADNITYKITKR